MREETMSEPVRGPVLSPVLGESEVEVRYAETDQMGVVHHANYIVWFEMARTRLCSLSGFHYAEVERTGHLLMVVGVEASYRKPARYGDTVRVACRVDHLGSRGMRFAYEVRKADELLATGKTEHVWVEAATGRPCRMPELVREPFRRLAGLPAEARS
jgi:acyl-CoA thioester hydrolase